MLHEEVQRGQIREENPPIPTGVWPTSRTRHLGPGVILPMVGISQDMKKQNNKLSVSNEKALLKINASRLLDVRTNM